MNIIFVLAVVVFQFMGNAHAAATCVNPSTGVLSYASGNCASPAVATLTTLSAAALPAFTPLATHNATQAQVNNILSSLSSYATTSSLSSYATTTSLSGYATTSSLSGFASASSVSSLQQQVQILNAAVAGGAGGSSVPADFDSAFAAALFSFMLAFTVGCYLVAKNAGVIISAIRYW